MQVRPEIADINTKCEFCVTQEQLKRVAVIWQRQSKHIIGYIAIIKAVSAC